MFWRKKRNPLIAELLQNASPEYPPCGDTEAFCEINRVICRRNASLPLSFEWPKTDTSGAVVRAVASNQL